MEAATRSAIPKVMLSGMYMKPITKNNSGRVGKNTASMKNINATNRITPAAP
jgi:hypothetical protein